MEDNKRKKKNKKKKGKQNKTSEVGVSARETASVEQNRVAALEQNHYLQFSGTSDAENVGVLEYDTSVDEGQADGTEDGILDEDEKQIWLKRELPKCLEEELKQVQRSWIWKEASLDGQIKQLEREKDCYIQTEAILEKKIIQLQREKDTWLQKEVNMEEKIKELLNAIAFWTQKGASLEDKIKHLESDKEFWALKEKSTKEVITRLNEDNTRLHTQVKELEESRNGLFQENQRLMETISNMWSQIQHLEKENAFSAFSAAEMEKVQQISKDEDSNAQIEATRGLVDKPLRENAELAEKSATAGHSSMVAFNLPEATPENATIAEFREMSESGKRMDLPVSIQSKDERTNAANADKEPTTITGIHVEELSGSYEAGKRMDPSVSIQSKDERTSADNADKEESITVTRHQIEEPSGSYEAGEIEEIVQIPLDDNEIQDEESQAVEIEGDVNVPLSEAPLIGAPFRLISFVARYVSGADLVRSGR